MYKIPLRRTSFEYFNHNRLTINPCFTKNYTHTMFRKTYFETSFLKNRIGKFESKRNYTSFKNEEVVKITKQVLDEINITIS